jgi:phosphoribosylglycinamide formyltransferase-1
MKILSDDFVSKYKYRIINIHPSLLPAFKGKDAIKNAFNCGVKITGVTIHFVVSEVDSGPIIMQKALSIKASDNLETLEHKIHALEHKIYPMVLDSLANEKIKMKKDK